MRPGRSILLVVLDLSENLLGHTDKLFKGSSFESGLIGTGFGGFLVHPLMERELEKIPGTPTKAQAQEILDRALKVLYYRDKSTYNKWSIGTAEKVKKINIYNVKFSTVSPHTIGI